MKAKSSRHQQTAGIAFPIKLTRTKSNCAFLTNYFSMPSFDADRKNAKHVTLRPKKIQTIGLIATVILVFSLAGCISVPLLPERRQTADQLADHRGWQPETINTGLFLFRAYRPAQIQPSQTLTIYIEGDGLSWISPDEASDDPTPINPTALRMALAHPSGQAVYLARPCQYTGVESPPCSHRYWTSARFSPEIVRSTGQAIDRLKAEFGASKIILVGYSGGATVAALLAATRNDTIQLITVAGNLDPDAWTKFHHLTPLTGSLNPVGLRKQLGQIPQVHYLGAKDQNIPPELARQWPEEITGHNHANLNVIADFDHRCCWPDHWQTLLPVYGE